MTAASVRPVFRSRPRWLPVDLRAPWRMALVMIVVDACWGRRASRLQVQALSWVLLRPTVREEIPSLLSQNTLVSRSTPHIDNAVERAVDMAIGFGLLVESRGRVTLSNDGRSALNEIIHHNVFEVERQTLRALPNRFTQSDAERVLGIGGRV